MIGTGRSGKIWQRGWGVKVFIVRRFDVLRRA
jgi:hypothetical protein